MDNRFSNIFGLTEEQALATIDIPLEELKDKSDRYVAVAHLINFPTERSINTLIAVIEDRDPDMYHRISRRKAVESLGRLKATVALPIIRSCLQDEDIYTVENAVWTIGELECQDKDILAEIAELLTQETQNHRIIIQTLAKLNDRAALDKIRSFTKAENDPVASAAIAAVARLGEDYSEIDRVVGFLQNKNVTTRRSCIQDLIDAKYYEAIPAIATTPVSIAFRLRGVKLLAEAGITEGALDFRRDVESHLDLVIRDNPTDIRHIYQYAPEVTLKSSIQGLYHTDFGWCYLASKTLLERYSDTAPQALLDNYTLEGYNDYGAHYHILKLLGWLKHAPSYDLFAESLNKAEPQFQKSRAAAALALGNLGDTRAIPLLKEALTKPIFDLKYACLLALEQLGEKDAWELAINDANFLIRQKASSTS
jgi:bilin biosynthesis protein